MKYRDFRQEDITGKPFDARLMRRLFGYAWPYRGYIALSVLLLLLITVTDLVRPYLIKIAIDEHLLQAVKEKTGWASHARALYKLVVIFLLTIFLNFVLNYVQAYLLQFTGQKILFALRREVFSHLLKLSPAFFDRNPVGRLVTRVTNDIESLNEMYSGVFINLFKDLFLIAGIIFVMLKLHLKLALISFTGIPLVLGAALLYQLKARKAFREVRIKLAQVNSFLQEHLSGMRIIQLFRREKEKMQQFKGLNAELYLASMRELLAFALFRPAMDLIYALVLALLIWYGGGQVIQAKLSFGVLYAFINYLEQFFRPINDLTEKYSILQSAMASSERIFQLLDEEITIKDSEQAKDLPVMQGKIEFDRVWFAYQDEDWVLKDVSFTIEPGQTFALVGATGAGKSSVINLLNRFYDVQKGEIRIDGVPIKEIRLADLRSQIGVVMQDVFLFSGTIAGNIRLGNDSIPMEKVREVADYVHASRFIAELPGKFGEEVVERGATLSTGERQLLAFARALAYDPAVLVLDEATAHIDTETELLIQDALKKLTANRTTIIVAHRLSTIQHADCILVFHHGRIQEAGTHRELLAKRGLYYQLYLLQYKDQLAGG